MRVCLHRMKKGPEYDALVACIEKGAADGGISAERATVVLAGIMERLTDLVAAGKVVPIFNVFKVGANLEERRAKHALNNRGFPYCVPRFVAGKPFRRQVKATAPNSRAAKDALDDCSRRRRAGHLPLSLRVPETE